MIKSIWFDGGGVIIKDVGSHIRPLLKEKYDIPDMDARWKQASPLFNKGEISLEKFAAIISEGKFTAKDILDIYPSLVHPVSGTLDIIKQLQGKYVLLHVNNEAKEFDEIRNELIGHFKYFDRRFSSWILHKAKPDLEYYQEVLKRTEFSPDECVFVDDRLENIAAAQSLGIQTILFKDAEQLKAELKGFGVDV